jgi:hypothetical protein
MENEEFHCILNPFDGIPECKCTGKKCQIMERSKQSQCIYLQKGSAVA